MTDFPVYYGNSMHRVFTVGERLVLENIAFEHLQPGDIIAVRQPEKKQYVHRVIEKNRDFALTMGDNNAVADAVKITCQTDFSLVVAAVDLHGKRRSISRGPAGMREFASHRRRRFWRSALRKILFKCGKLFFWRKLLYEKKNFGSEVCYYWQSRAVARLTADGKVVYVSWRDFLRFRVPEDK